MASYNVVFQNGSNQRLKFSYRFSTTASNRKEHLKTLEPKEAFLYPIRDNSTYETIDVDSCECNGLNHYEPTNIVINADTMSQASMIRVVEDGTARQFRLEITTRPLAPTEGWIASAIGMVRKAEVCARNLMRRGDTRVIPP